MTEDRYFQVSGKGNGIGITVLRLVGTENPTGPSILTLHVLPKIWSDYKNLRKEWLDEGHDRKRKDFKLLRTLPDFTSSEFEGVDTWHSYLYEMDTLQLPQEWANCLATVSSNSPEFEENTHDIDFTSEKKQEDEEEREDGEVDPLWQEVTKPRKGCREEELKPLEDASATFMWDMLSHYDQQPSRVAGHRDFPPAGTELFPHIPAMREVFYAQFVRYALEAVRHRKPVFLPVQEELGFVRGRMVPQGLIDRKVKQRLPILCEFDALTTDSYIWQVIRAATQLSATSDNQKTLDNAVEVDAHIRDVRLVQSSTLLTGRIAANEFARLSTDLKKAYLLGRAIISEQFGIGVEDPLTEGGVIANIKYTTSDLWEKIVAGYLRQSTSQAEIREQEKLHLYYRDDQKSPAGKPKTPDLIVTTQQKTVVFDAKYKFAKGSITKAGMSDQYQLTTYAYRMGCSAYLVYPQRVAGDCDTVDLKDHYLYLSPPGYGYQQQVEEDWKKIGVLSLSFPSPGGTVTESALPEGYRERIREFFEKT